MNGDDQLAGVDRHRVDRINRSARDVARDANYPNVEKLLEKWEEE